MPLWLTSLINVLKYLDLLCAKMCIRIIQNMYIQYKLYGMHEIKRNFYYYGFPTFLDLFHDLSQFSSRVQIKLI